ncbi:hypothetical protein ACWEV3_19815 [Saccharopolyspora sp. NPDC003752]
MQDVIKGYELSDGRILVLSEEDLAELPLPSSHTIEVAECPCRRGGSGPVRSLLRPAAQHVGLRAYCLLRGAMTKASLGCSGDLVYGLRDHVNSYRNNLPVYVDFFDANGNLAWRIRPGGSSSDSRPFTGEYAVCT